MMWSVLIGSIVISLLHALIPNHWLPIIAIGRKEGWSQTEITQVTFQCALAHGGSTISMGLLLSFVGTRIAASTHQLLHWIGPLILIVLGIYFMYRHHRHKHFHIKEAVPKKSKHRLMVALVAAMFFSPCLEIEGFYLLGGMKATWLPWIISASYLLITTTGMLLLVRYAYKGLLRMNGHALEHNAGMITGGTLVVTGMLTFFIQ